MKGLGGVNQMLSHENHGLRKKIAELEQAQINGMFLEQLTCHALSGVLAADPLIPVQAAADRALEASQLLFNLIIAQGREALMKDEEANVNKNLKDNEDGEAAPQSESSLIVAP